MVTPELIGNGAKSTLHRLSSGTLLEAVNRHRETSSRKPSPVKQSETTHSLAPDGGGLATADAGEYIEIGGRRCADLGMVRLHPVLIVAARNYSFAFLLIRWLRREDCNRPLR
jgi:hypothetical protein